MNNYDSNVEQQGDSTKIPDSEHNNDTNTMGKRSYASLFKNNRAPDESSLLHFIEQPAGDIQLASDEIETVENTHGYCLVGYV